MKSLKTKTKIKRGECKLMKKEDVVVGKTKVLYENKIYTVVGITGEEDYRHEDYRVLLERKDDDGDLISKTPSLGNITKEISLKDILLDFYDKYDRTACPGRHEDCDLSCTKCILQAFEKEIMEVLK